VILVGVNKRQTKILKKGSLKTMFIAALKSFGIFLSVQKAMHTCRAPGKI
jgi:hypothetical protein